jgi:hypothetical protein
VPETFPEPALKGCANIFWFRMKNINPPEYAGSRASSSTILVSDDVNDLSSIRLCLPFVADNHQNVFPVR